MLLQSNLGARPAGLLRETGNLAFEADPRIPPNPKKMLFLEVVILFDINQLVSVNNNWAASTMPTRISRLIKTYQRGY